MINIHITREGKFAFNSKKIKEVITAVLEENGIVSDCDVDVAVVGKNKMDELNEKYYKDEVYEHPIFTFPQVLGEGGNDFVLPPDNKIHLGQMVISYPFVVEEAREKNKLIDDVISELAQHGSLHLIGIHHD